MAKRTKQDLAKHKRNITKCDRKYIITKTTYNADLFGAQKKQALEILPLHCHSYFCPVCAGRKKNQLYMRLVQGTKHQSWRMITLTTRNHGYTTEKDFRNLSKAWNKLITLIRRRIPQVQYFRVVEFGKKGMLHLHILINVYIPKQLIKHYWEKYTTAYIVDVRRVGENRKAINYVIKYFEKSLQNEENNNLFFLSRARHYSFSRNFAKLPASPQKWELFSGEIFSAQKIYDWFALRNITASENSPPVIYEKVPKELVVALACLS